MEATAAEGSLTVEVDEDMLVDNAATATLFSPGMWVQRPTRTPNTRRFEARPEGLRNRSDLAEGAEPLLLPIPMLALAQPPESAAAPRSGGAGPSTASPAAGRGCAGAAPGGSGLGGSATPTSPGLNGDPDLAYLTIADDRECAEREYLQQDTDHMAALEEAYARLREQNAAMEQQLKGVVAAVNDVVGENHTVKSLLAQLKVRREDFVFNQQQTIGAQQEAIGLRLLRNLEEEEGQQQQQQQGPGAYAGAQQQQQQTARRPQRAAAVPLHIQQQQQQQAAATQQAPLHGQQQQSSQQEQQQQQGLGDPGLFLAPAATPFDASPGGLLPIGTPSMLRTVSPKIAAFRNGGDMLLAGSAELVAPPTAPPASPYDFPAEAQIAAAALTAKQGDTAAALLTLLDKAIEGRLERQQHAAQQHQQLALLQQHVQQAHHQQQQQQQQMFSM